MFIFISFLMKEIKANPLRGAGVLQGPSRAFEISYFRD
jgi:hypothetical protein